ncbi:hypothetical protein MAR_036228, partial [Mya arenaria]
MLLSHEGLLHKGSEFCQAIKFVIKLQISTLLQQLAESGEESVVLTANVLEGTADRLGSLRGTGFLEDHEQLGNQFLSYCAETRRFSVDDEGDNLPARTTLMPGASYEGQDAEAKYKTQMIQSESAENLDSPLVIDDDSKPESESREGLDLSNKKRKMSADDIYPMSADDPQEGAGLNAAANQSEEQEFAGGAG